MKTLTSLSDIGDLWLPWYVTRGNRTALVRDISRELAVARALQVRNVIEDPTVRELLEQPTAHSDQIGAWSHRDGIRYHLGELNPDVPLGPFPAWSITPGLLLRDGCHRICALYELAPAHFELQLAIEPAPADAIDASARLHRQAPQS